jgi:hypothetical protein
VKPEDFRQEYPVGPEPAPKELMAFDLWAWHEATCEEYDQTVCTGKLGNFGEAMPATPAQRRAITRHASSNRTRVRVVAEAENIPKEVLEQALRNFQHAVRYLKTEHLANHIERAEILMKKHCLDTGTQPGQPGRDSVLVGRFSRSPKVRTEHQKGSSHGRDKLH